MTKDNTILKVGGYAYIEGKVRSPVLSVTMPEPMLQKIKQQAKDNNISAGELVRRFCADGLDKVKS